MVKNSRTFIFPYMVFQYIKNCIILYINQNWTLIYMGCLGREGSRGKIDAEIQKLNIEQHR